MSSFHDFTVLLLLLHCWGDFQLQSKALAQAKTTEKPALLKHLAIHALLLLFPLYLGYKSQEFSAALFCVLLILVSHGVLDLIKILLAQKMAQHARILFILDQVLHITIIVILSEVVFSSVFSSIRLNHPSGRYVLDRLFLCSLITKPANVLFKVIFSKYDFRTETSGEAGESGAGALVGSLERILSVIFVEMQQINAIGFIYTAKSIARFKQIEENKSFAEYYLIGTLYSILFALSAYYVVLVSAI